MTDSRLWKKTYFNDIKSFDNLEFSQPDLVLRLMRSFRFQLQRFDFLRESKMREGSMALIVSTFVLIY